METRPSLPTTWKIGEEENIDKMGARIFPVFGMGQVN
jgi:hypothetical protein